MKWFNPWSYLQWWHNDTLSPDKNKKLHYLAGMAIMPGAITIQNSIFTVIADAQTTFFSLLAKTKWAKSSSNVKKIRKIRIYKWIFRIINKWIGNWHVKVSFNAIPFYFFTLPINQKSLSQCKYISCTRNGSFKYLLKADVNVCVCVCIGKSTLQLHCSRCRVLLSLSSSSTLVKGGVGTLINQQKSWVI